jgi:hypothetical protein
LGFKVIGKVTPEKVNPVPTRVARLIVTGAVPVEDKMRDWVVGVLSTTLPKPMLVELTLSVGTPDPSCREKVLAKLLALAVRMTV